jgi:hypothetical protein
MSDISRLPQATEYQEHLAGRERQKKAHTLVSLDAEGKSGQEKKKGRKSPAGLDDIPHDMVSTRPPTTLLSTRDPF